MLLAAGVCRQNVLRASVWRRMNLHILCEGLQCLDCPYGAAVGLFELFPCPTYLQVGFGLQRLCPLSHSPRRAVRHGNLQQGK